MSKAKVISVLNHKGGVGKTTTTINLGGALRQKGYKVLLIDLDGQANLTESLGFSAELPQTIYGAMKGEYGVNQRGRAGTYLSPPYQGPKGKIRLYPDRLPPLAVAAHA